MLIDTTFDFRADSTTGDPDTGSPTLKAYQRYLYSKPLPNGEIMVLDKNLRWKDFRFSSDSILHDFHYWPSYQHIISAVEPAVLKRFHDADYTIGGEILFPCYRVPGVMSINQARGCCHQIRDRIDLTLECIRRHYLGQKSPLTKCLTGYKPFFDLFVDFRGYVDFFHMQDLVTADYGSIRFLCWFDGFESTFPLPRSVEEYPAYIDQVLSFNAKRNERIATWCRLQEKG